MSVGVGDGLDARGRRRGRRGAPVAFPDERARAWSRRRVR